MLVIDQVVGILNAVYQFGSMAVSTVRNIRDVALGARQYYLHKEQDLVDGVVDQTQEQNKDLEEKKEKKLSNSTYYIDKMNSVPPYFLGTAVNYIFSPNVALVLGLIGAAAAFFSPLGPAVGIATVVLLGTVTIAGVLIGGAMTQAIDTQKQINSVTKEIEKEGVGLETPLRNIEKINQKMGVDIDVSTILSHSMAGSLSRIASVMEKPKTEKPTFFESIKIGLAFRFPINAFMLGTGIATLNPLTIGLTIPMMILGEAGAIRQDRANSVANAKFEEQMADKRHKFGLPEVEGDEGLKGYTAILSEMKRTKFALARFERDYESLLKGMQDRGITPTAENLRQIFQNQYLATEPHVEIPTHVMSYGQALLQSFNNGWTWSRSMDAKSPYVDEHEWAYNDNAYKHAAIQQEVKARMPGKSQDAVIERTNAVVREIEALKQNPNAEVSQDARDIHQTLQEKKVNIGQALDDIVEASKPKPSFVERLNASRQAHSQEGHTLTK